MPLLEKWTPLREFDAMDRRMRRFFGDLGSTPAPMPAADVYETDGELVVELEVPGFDEKELEIEVRDDGGGGAKTAGGADGNGLVGMRQRVALLGGVLTTGPLSGGGYRVATEIPIEENA